MILQRYILRELLGSFAFAFCTVLSICLIGTIFQVFRTFPSTGLEIVGKALPMAIGTMATWVILVASCTSSTLVYARLAAENEITAMRTCGIHVSRIIAPAVLLGLFLVGAAYPLNEIVVPWARMAQRMLFRESTLHLLRLPPPGAQDFKIGVWRITYTDYRDGRMLQPTISRYQSHTLVMECFASTGMILAHDGPLRIVMTNPSGWEKDAKGQRQEMFRAGGDVTYEIPPEKPLDDSQRQLVDQPSKQLWDKYFATRDPAVRNPILLILHTRYAASLAPMLLVLVAMPIGILVRRGSRLAGLGAALPPLLIYFVCYFVFQGLGDKNRVSPVLAAYAPDLFLGALGLSLLWGVARK